MKKLTKIEIQDLDAYFRASNYLSVAQLYLKDNPLLLETLKLSDIKTKLVGHFGTVPGQNFIYTHLNRIINKYNLNMIYVIGPGHGGNAALSHVYLEGSYTKIYPEITEDISGIKKLCKQFSFPGGVSSHVAPETPGSINEGGELGYSLAHSFGAVLDNKDLIAVCIVGDGEAETGPLATSWHGNKFLNPKKDGAVLPILHLNGYKISNPTIFSRMSDKQIKSYFIGCGYDPIIVENSDTNKIHQQMASAMDTCIEKIHNIWNKTRNDKKIDIIWPMIILRTPKGWTGPKEIDGKKIEGSFRAHQIPLQVDKDHPQNLPLLEAWLKSYKPEELFDETGKLIKELNYLKPVNPMGMNKHANGGLIRSHLLVPNFKDYKIDVIPGDTISEDTKNLGKFVRDIIKNNMDTFRVFGPDEAMSNRLSHVFEVTSRQWNSKILDTDEFIANDGRIMDAYLSEHLCEGWLEGYLLTGRHGFMHSYEAFIRVIDSMVSQHAKWLKVTKELPWRAPISSLNFLLTSHVWQQDHNGFTHQDPGFLNHLISKKPDTVRMYLPFDTNTLLSTFDHCIKSKNYINVIVASKHPSTQWMNIEDATNHCTKGLGTLDFASNDEGNPDIIMCASGDVPTFEIIAATTLLRKFIKNIKIRTINVVDLMKLVSSDEHPHGLTDLEYDYLFTKDKHIIFAFHGYPNLIHQLTYKRNNQNLHVHGYNEEGTITTAFDMRVQNKIDRYNLVLSALKYLDETEDTIELKTYCLEKLQLHKEYIVDKGHDMPEITSFNFNEEMKKITDNQ